ncbi:hypothetical protein F7725_005877, partial [Dissostichus mawsoni]
DSQHWEKSKSVSWNRVREEEGRKQQFSPHLCLRRRFFCGRMGAGALTICHNKTAALVKEDMKKMVNIPILRPRTVTAKHTRLFGVSLLELQEKGLVEDGVPLVMRRMVKHLSTHALNQEGLFRVNGNVRAVETLKQRLESGEDVDLLSEADSCTVASLLKRFLRDLPQGLVDSTSGDDVSWSDMRDLLQQLPDVHYSLLRYVCHFLTIVESKHEENRMTAHNLATVFGPTMKDQNICNKIMVKLIQNYSDLFETARDGEGCTEELPTLITVKEVQETDASTQPQKSPSHLKANTPTPVPRKKAGQKNPPQEAELLNKSSTIPPKARQRKNKVRKGKSGGMLQVIPRPSHSAGLPHAKTLSIPIILPLTSGLRSPIPEPMETALQDSASPLGHLDVSSSGSMEDVSRSVCKERAQ